MAIAMGVILPEFVTAHARVNNISDSARLAAVSAFISSVGGRVPATVPVWWSTNPSTGGFDGYPAPLGYQFPSLTLLNGLNALGVTPSLYVEFNEDGAHGKANYASWTAGEHDDWIDALARGGKNYGKTLILRMFHEMEGGWSWGPGQNGNPGDRPGLGAAFIPAWQHIVARARAQGATNIQFFFCPYLNYGGAESNGYIASYWPTDAYVDYAGGDGYAWLRAAGNGYTMWSTLGGACDYYLGLTSKPLIIGEHAIQNSYNSVPLFTPAQRAAWIAGAGFDGPPLFSGNPNRQGNEYDGTHAETYAGYRGMSGRFTNVAGTTYYNIPQGGVFEADLDYRLVSPLDGDTTALAAYASAMGSYSTGYSTAHDLSPVAQTPTAPLGVSAVRGNAQATVSWSPPIWPATNEITGYTATSSPGGFTGTAGAGGTSCVVSGLTNGTAYTFTVTATNSNGVGTASAASNSVTPGTVPGAPTIGTAVRGNGQATVAWSAPANGGYAITDYVVTASPGGAVGSYGTALSGVFSGLTNGVAYTFSVTATNAIGTGSASSASNSITPGTVPGVPTSVVATAGHDEATVTWVAPASNGYAITGYTVTSSPGGFTGSWSSGPLSAVVGGLTNYQAYTFSVTATNALGTSSASAASNSATPTPALIVVTVDSIVGTGVAKAPTVTAGVATAGTWGDASIDWDDNGWSWQGVVIDPPVPPVGTVNVDALTGTAEVPQPTASGIIQTEFTATWGDPGVTWDSAIWHWDGTSEYRVHDPFGESGFFGT